MAIRKSRLLVYSCVAILLLLLLLPGFCQCPTCVVIGAKAEPCRCTVLGIYLGREALSLVTGKTTGFRDAQGVGKAGCENR